MKKGVFEEGAHGTPDAGFIVHSGVLRNEEVARQGLVPDVEKNALQYSVPFGDPNLNLAVLINQQARYLPDAVALVFGDERLTYRQFGARVARCANMLRELGIQKGDRVATLMANSRELLEIYWATVSIGAVLVPLSPMLMPAGVAGLVADAGVKCLFTQRSLVNVINDIRATQKNFLRDRMILIDGAEDGFGDYRTKTAAAADKLVPAEVTSADVFNIMYSSGTTGMPKGIVHTHYIRAMYQSLFASAFRMTPESVVLQTGSLVFNGAMLLMFPCFGLGGRYVLHGQFDPEATMETIERERVTHTMLVPSQIIAVLNSPNYKPERLKSLECILSLGAPLLQEYKDRLNRDLPNRFYELYGLTEGFVTILDKTQAVRKAGSVGTPPVFFDMRIVREDGSDAPAGEVGEIVGRGPILMPYYFNRPDLTADALRDGWLFTGDMGYVDDEGYLYLVDRKKDMIDSGGVKVYPKDIEEVACKHPAIREVAVFGVPHDKWGETPLAAVVLNKPGAATADELREWINARVAARYQRVSEVVIMADFPRSAAGKTLKREMREPYWQGKNRKI